MNWRRISGAKDILHNIPLEKIRKRKDGHCSKTFFACYKDKIIHSFIQVNLVNDINSFIANTITIIHHHYPIMVVVAKMDIIVEISTMLKTLQPLI